MLVNEDNERREHLVRIKALEDALDKAIIAVRPTTCVHMTFRDKSELAEELHKVRYGRA